MHRPVRLKVLMARLNDIPAADRARTVQLEMGEMNRCRRDGTRRGAMGLQFAPQDQKQIAMDIMQTAVAEIKKLKRIRQRFRCRLTRCRSSDRKLDAQHFGGAKACPTTSLT